MTRAKSHRNELPSKYERGFLKGLDRRTQIYARLTAIHDEIVDDLGGKDGLSHTKLALIERFVFLEAVIQKMELDMAKSKTLNGEELNRWIQGLNSMTGLAKTIGLERRQRAVNVRDYAKKRAAS